MDGDIETEALGLRFETHRSHLRAVAYRMLGSLSEADDAVQEAWLRLSRVDANTIDNLAGWLRTVVSRLCLDMLRSRGSRREELTGQQVPDQFWDPGNDPAQEAEAVDSVGRALLVVLDALAPAERIAFVLHDLFAVPFDQIAPVLGRTPSATKKLASRARLRVQGTPALPVAELGRHRKVVDAFLAASRGGDINALLAVLAPDVVRRADSAALPPGAPLTAHGSRTVAKETAGFARRSRFAESALVNGVVGVVVAPRGRLVLALALTIADDRITAYDVIGDPERLARLDVAVLPVPADG